MNLLGKKTEPVTDANSAPTPKRKNHKKLFFALGAIVIVLALVAILLPRGGNPGGVRGSAGTATKYLTSTAAKRDLSAKLTDSGALEPADSYTVISLVSGEILSADFETGDIVSEDDVLYQVDSSDASSNIERAEDTLDQRRRNYNKVLESKENLTVTAPIGGTISGFSVQSGSKVNNGTLIATIEDTDTLLLTEYYSEEYRSFIAPGMAATVSIPDQMLTLPGSVKEVYSLRRVSPTGVPCFAVTVQVHNPGSLTLNTIATCWLSGPGEDIYPTITAESGFEASARKTVHAEVSGTAETVHVRNGEMVQPGQILVEMTSDTIDDEITTARNSLRDAELSLEDRYDALDNYTIQAPISGTIVDKYYKTGENTETGKTLCTIFDLSRLTVTLYIDELDIRDVSVGQRAQVTCDSVANTAYEGVVTEVSINGTTSGGVTTYPVKVEIDETDGLLPGMNVDVSILISENPGVLTIPADAVQSGSRVLVKTADGSTGSGAPEGYDYVKVATGISDGDYVQVLSGLSEGDQITWQPATGSNNMFGMMMGIGNMHMNGMMGGMSGGSRPMGGSQMGSRPGGMPSGGSRP